MELIFQTKATLIFSLKFYEDINCKFSRNPNDFDFSNPCYGFWKQNMKIKNSFDELPTMWHESMSCKIQHHIQCTHPSDKIAHLHKDYSPNKPKHGKNVTHWDNKFDYFTLYGSQQKKKKKEFHVHNSGILIIWILDFSKLQFFSN